VKKIRPTSGPGARQPILKLPSEVRGKRITRHPFVYLLEDYIEQAPEDNNKSVLAKHLGVRPQSIYKWERACRKDRNFPLPVLRAQQIATFFKVPPSTFRPDFPWGNA
jgi:DNA-binding XRE family transcriptional regulator